MWEVPWGHLPPSDKTEAYVLKTMVGAGILAFVGKTKAKEATDSALARFRSGETASAVVIVEVAKLFSKFPPRERDRKYQALTTFVETEVLR